MKNGVLAINGGSPVLSEIQIISRNKYTQEDIDAINVFLRGENVLSFYGDEGLQKQYELELSKYFNINYCILVNSGTNALFAGYFALSLQPDDEVIVPAHSFHAIATPLLLLHVKVVVVDCDEYTGLIDTDSIFEKISPKTKAIAINHLCGDSLDNLEAFCAKIKSKNIKIIEDLSLAFGATNNNKKLGTFGDICCCSLGSTKMLSGGQGGFVLTDNREYFERIVLLGCFGKRASQNVLNPFYRRFVNTSYGLNIRMQSMAIAVSYNKFRNINELIKQRHIRYDMLTDCFSKYTFITPPRNNQNKTRGSWHGYYALYDESKTGIKIVNIVAALRAEGLDVQNKAHYSLLDEESIFHTPNDGFYGIAPNPRKIDIEKPLCPKAHLFNNKILTFPLFLDEDLGLIEKYCTAIVKVFNNLEELR